MVDVSKHALATTLIDETAAIPVAIAPTGLTGLFHANGEMLGARAAEAFGIPFCLSTMSICSSEDVSEVTTKPFWFQLYLMRDRGFNEEIIERANAAECSALMLTVDMPVQGLRRRDPKKRPYHSAAADTRQCTRCHHQVPGRSRCCAASAEHSAT